MDSRYRRTFRLIGVRNNGGGRVLGVRDVSGQVLASSRGIGMVRELGVDSRSGSGMTERGKWRDKAGVWGAYVPDPSRGIGMVRGLGVGGMLESRLRGTVRRKKWG